MSLAAGPSPSGGAWYFTDLATANALGLTVVQIQNENGAFVGPTPETMAAAVPTMTAGRTRRAHPEPMPRAGRHPAQALPAGGVEPYPLTYVEYGIAPSQPLADDSTSAGRTLRRSSPSGSRTSRPRVRPYSPVAWSRSRRTLGPRRPHARAGRGNPRDDALHDIPRARRDPEPQAARPRIPAPAPGGAGAGGQCPAALTLAAAAGDTAVDQLTPSSRRRRSKARRRRW